MITTDNRALNKNTHEEKEEWVKAARLENNQGKPYLFWKG